MTRAKKSLCLIGAAFLLAFCLQESSAAACNQTCRRVLSGGPFCYQCWETGEFTGVTCEQSGPCGCYYTQNTCGLRSAATTPGALKESIFGTQEGEAKVSSAQAPAATFVRAAQ